MGEGSYGEVFKAVNDEGTEVAIKVYYISNLIIIFETFIENCFDFLCYYTHCRAQVTLIRLEIDVCY